MWDHVRLLRGTLLLMSLLTLSGLHAQQDQPAGCWAAVWLLPLLHSLVFTVGCVAAAVDAGSSLEAIFDTVVSLSLLNAILMMLYFLRYGGRLRAVFHRLTALEKSSAAFRRPGELTTAWAKFAVIVGLSVAATTLSMAQFFSNSPLCHPYYPNPLLVPAALQTPGWYWVITSLQVLHDVSVAGVNAAFDLLVIGLADAVAMLLERISCQVRAEDDPDGLTSAAEVEEQKDGVPCKSSSNETFLVHPEAGGNFHKTTDILDEKSTTLERTQVIMSARIRPAFGSLVPAAFTSLASESQLRRLVATHRAVCRLASDAAQFCSLPLLSLYTIVTVTLLLCAYTTIVMLSSGRSGVLTGMVYVTQMLLRLLMVSCAGSRLIQQGELLHAALADASWSEGELSPAARLSLQLLLERTRQPPALHGWGLFTAQKTTMLSMLGFILTYTVILMQMVRW